MALCSDQVKHTGDLIYLSVQIPAVPSSKGWNTAVLSRNQDCWDPHSCSQLQSPSETHRHNTEHYTQPSQETCPGTDKAHEQQERGEAPSLCPSLCTELGTEPITGTHCTGTPAWAPLMAPRDAHGHSVPPAWQLPLLHQTRHMALLLGPTSPSAAGGDQGHSDPFRCAQGLGVNELKNKDQVEESKRGVIP